MVLAYLAWKDSQMDMDFSTKVASLLMNFQHIISSYYIQIFLFKKNGVPST